MTDEIRHTECDELELPAASSSVGQIPKIYDSGILFFFCIIDLRLP